MQSDISNWLKTVLSEERPKVAVHTMGFSPLIKLDLPMVTITENECPNLRDLPIGSIKAFPSGQYRLLCRSHGTGDVWHDVCARLMACRLSVWIQNMTNYVPTLEALNEQRITWQKCADALMNELLCKYCQKEKDEAYARGEGIQWVPNCDGRCKTVARILQEHVYEDYFCFTGHIDKYGDEELSELWVFPYED